MIPFLNISYVLNLHVSVCRAFAQCTEPHIFLSIFSAGKMLSHVLQVETEADAGHCDCRGRNHVPSSTNTTVTLSLLLSPTIPTHPQFI